MLQMAGRMGVLGTETAFEVLARANVLAAQGRSIINLGIGQPDFPTPEHIVEAGRKALADGHHGYTPANGIPALRAAVVADLFRRHRVEVPPDLVLIVPGGKVTMFFAILMLGEPGVEILCPNPSFPIYESVIRFSGATPVSIPLHESAGFSFSAAEVLEKITPRTRLLIINSPANPTGGVVPRDELNALSSRYLNSIFSSTLLICRATNRHATSRTSTDQCRLTLSYGSPGRLMIFNHSMLVGVRCKKCLIRLWEGAGLYISATEKATCATRNYNT
jgi:aspartate aminotransferase